MKITVYTITDCPFCKQEKDFLTAQGLQFEEKNVQTNREFLTEMLDVSDKFAGVPFTLVEKDSGEKVGLKGFTQSEFETALGLGSAAPAMAAAPAAVATPEAPAATPVIDTAAPAMPAADPVMPAAPADPMANTTSSMPDAAPNMPSMPSIDEAPQQGAQAPAEAPAAPANPQNQLDGLLADLQTKAQPDIPDFAAPGGSTAPAPAADPAMPLDVPAAPVAPASDPATTPQQ